jgi:hypothetical protein
MRTLQLPGVRRFVRHARGPRIERTEVDKIPTVVVWLGRLEYRRFEDPRAAIDANGDDAHRNVRRVERVMAERRDRIFRGRRPMHEGDRAERGLADRCARERNSCFVGEWNPPCNRRLHQQVVRMLAIGERDEMVRLSHLKQLAIAFRASRGAVETRHGCQGE